MRSIESAQFRGEDSELDRRAWSVSGSEAAGVGRPWLSLVEGTAGQGLLVRPFSALEVLPAEPDWLWQGMFALGNVTMLAGHPFSGKSMLMSGLLRALDTGAPFLGRPTRRTSALLVTEEDDTVLRNRAELFGLSESKSELVGRADSLLLDWQGLVEIAAKEALQRGHQLLVFDTFAGLAGLQDEQENDAGAITARLRPLREAAAQGLAVVFLHHMNGYGQPRGSKAFRAGVDISIRLFRQPVTSRMIRLEGEGRFPGLTPAKLYGELVMDNAPWSYRLREDTKARPAGAATNQLLMQALHDAEQGCLTYGDLDRLEGLSADIGKKRLPKWHKQGRVGRRGRGTKTDPYCWYPQAA